MNFTEKENYNFNDLVEIVKILRAPDGCPWDREQTHKSIRSNFIEETYEAVEAIDTDDLDLLKEELGDVLLQVALHAEIESEQGTFDINDVCDGICKNPTTTLPSTLKKVSRSGFLTFSSKISLSCFASSNSLAARF